MFPTGSMEVGTRQIKPIALALPTRFVAGLGPIYQGYPFRHSNAGVRSLWCLCGELGFQLLEDPGLRPVWKAGMGPECDRRCWLLPITSRRALPDG